jgi:Protein of unknown function (DUF2911)
MVLGMLVLAIAGNPSAQDPSCITSASAASLAKRASPLDSVSFSVGATRVKICYGRPSARGRTMLGGEHVPFGKLWRTGANEPTMIHTTGPLSVAGIKLEPGTYSVYTIPNAIEWDLIINRSTEQWGDEGSYNDAIKKQEVGRAKVKAYKLENHIEQLTIRPETKGGWSMLILEWEKTKVAIPLEAFK